MHKFTVDATNIDKYVDLEEEIVSADEAEMINLEEFELKDDEVFLEITNEESYHPGHIDRYCERDGKIWLIDDLNEDQAIEIVGYDKNALLNAFKDFFK